MRYTELNWRPTERDGSIGRSSVSVRLPVGEADCLHDLWRQIERTPPGEQRSRRIRELRIQLDLYAIFPGTRLEAPPEVPDRRPPAYLRPVPALA